MNNEITNKMKLREELEPKIDIAEKLYPAIVKLIEEYTDFCDENGDEENVEYNNLENKLYELTRKDMSQYNLWEYWEEEGLEVLSFKIALPEPVVVCGITKDELTEIVKRLKVDIFKNDYEKTEKTFKEEFNYYLEDYYHKLLEINFKNYEYEYFERQKGKDGKYFEYSIDEIAEKILRK